MCRPYSGNAYIELRNIKYPLGSVTTLLLFCPIITKSSVMPAIHTKTFLDFTRKISVLHSVFNVYVFSDLLTPYILPTLNDQYII